MHAPSVCPQSREVLCSTLVTGTTYLALGYCGLRRPLSPCFERTLLAFYFLPRCGVSRGVYFFRHYQAATSRIDVVVHRN